MHSIEVLLNLQAQLQTVPPPPSGGNTTESFTASTVVQSTSALLNVFSALSSSDHEARGFGKSTIDEYTIQRNGLELRVRRRNA